VTPGLFCCNNPAVARRTTGWWPALALLWLFWVGSALAQDPISTAAATAVPRPAPITLAPGTAPVALDGHARYWIDASGQASIDEVEAAADALPWAAREGGQQYRVDSKALWFEFDAVAPQPGRWYVELASSGLDRAQLFYRGADGRWVVHEAGDSKAVSQWPLPGRVPTFALSSQTTQPVRYWLRIEHARVNFAVPIALYDQATLLASREREQFLLGAYFGLAALITLVAAGNALAYRDRIFGAYAVYVFSLSLGQIAYLGVGAQHVWNQWLKWNEVATFVLPGVSTAFGLWFVKIVTEPARFSRALDLAVWSLIAALLSAVALDTFLTSRASFALVMALTAMALVLVAGLIALVWAQGNDPHIRMVALGFLPVLVMAIFPVARGLNLIPNSTLTRYGLSIGAALEMPILFYALSLRGSRRREAELRAATLSHSDALTGLADQNSLLRQLDVALARARSQRHQFAVLAIKIANFDAIGAEFGGSAGERTLVLTASHLRRVITDIDTAARIGEQEFAVLLEGPTTSDAAIARAQQLIAKGLQHSGALPPTVTLKYQIVVALLPEGERDAAATFKWIRDAVLAVPADNKRAIRPLNF